MSFVELRKLDTPSVSLLNYGEKNTQKGEAVFQALVLKLVRYFGANWTESQIIDCGKVCFTEWYYLTFAELAHFSHKVKSGAFKVDGRALIYGQFSPAVLVDWFVTYATDNAEQRARYFQGQLKKSVWVDPENPVPEEQVTALLQDFAAELTKAVEQEKQEDTIKRTQDKETAQQKVKRYDGLISESEQLKRGKKSKTDKQVPDVNPIPDLP